MDEAAPQAAPGTTASTPALDALRLDWGEAYLVGYDDGHGWWAVHRDQIGGLLTADGPVELRAAISDDYAMRRVER